MYRPRHLRLKASPDCLTASETRRQTGTLGSHRDEAVIPGGLHPGGGWQHWENIPPSSPKSHHITWAAIHLPREGKGTPSSSLPWIPPPSPRQDPGVVLPPGGRHSKHMISPAPISAGFSWVLLGLPRKNSTFPRKSVLFKRARTQHRGSRYSMQTVPRRAP